MADLTDAQIDAALERGRPASIHEPRAAAVRYDGDLGRLMVDLTNGCSFAFPARLAQGLKTATDEQLAPVEILGAGSGLHWEALDVDLSLPRMLAGLLGTKTHMARLAGRTESLARAAAAQANSGRPRKPALG